MSGSTLGLCVSLVLSVSLYIYVCVYIYIKKKFKRVVVIQNLSELSCLKTRIRECEIWTVTYAYVYAVSECVMQCVVHLSGSFGR